MSLIANRYFTITSLLAAMFMTGTSAAITPRKPSPKATAKSPQNAVEKTSSKPQSSPAPKKEEKDTAVELMRSVNGELLECKKEEYGHLKDRTHEMITTLSHHNESAPIDQWIIFVRPLMQMAKCANDAVGAEEALRWYRQARDVALKQNGKNKYDNADNLNAIDTEISAIETRIERKEQPPAVANADITEQRSAIATVGVPKSAFRFSFGFPVGGNYNSFSTPLPFSPSNPDQIFLSGPNGLDTYCTQGKPCELGGNYDLTQNHFNSLHGFGGFEIAFAHISDDREIFVSGAIQSTSDMYSWIVGIGYGTSIELLDHAWWQPSLRMGAAIVAGVSTFSTTQKSTDTKPIEFLQYGNILSTTKDTDVEASSGLQGGLRAELDLMFRRKVSIGVHPSVLAASGTRFSVWVPFVLRFHWEASLQNSDASAKGAAQ